ncbi:MAG: type II toxin-antitoxin system RelE/ParE family toxin [Nitrospinota bacterium]|nr:type II toxin-antitoxin system RelE/ParE family toxin [Nitrospinota bacterium]
MKIEFSSRKLAKICGDAKLATKEWGRDRCLKIFQRLTQLVAARTLDDYIRFVPGARCHRLKGNRKGMYAISLNQPFRLIIEPSLVEPEMDDDMKYEARVIGVRIVKVEDYHG